MYNDSIRAAMMEEFSYKNAMQHRSGKIVLNIGLAQAVNDIRKPNRRKMICRQSAGQMAVVTKAKKSIAGFRVREDMPLTWREVLFVATA
jgi:large subunit ribosomal protein L5